MARTFSHSFLSFLLRNFIFLPLQFYGHQLSQMGFPYTKFCFISTLFVFLRAFNQKAFHLFLRVKIKRYLTFYISDTTMTQQLFVHLSGNIWMFYWCHRFACFLVYKIVYFSAFYKWMDVSAPVRNFLYEKN